MCSAVPSASVAEVRTSSATCAAADASKEIERMSFVWSTADCAIACAALDTWTFWLCISWEPAVRSRTAT
jgi:hypothetical protein